MQYGNNVRMVLEELIIFCTRMCDTFVILSFENKRR
jgi:hypothetical protein